MAPSVPISVLVAVAGCSLVIGYLAGQTSSVAGANSQRINMNQVTVTDKRHHDEDDDVRGVDASRRSDDRSVRDDPSAAKLTSLSSALYASSANAADTAPGRAKVGRMSVPALVGGPHTGWNCCVHATPTCDACFDLSMLVPNKTRMEWVGDARSSAMDKARGPCYKGGGE